MYARLFYILLQEIHPFRRSLVFKRAQGARVPHNLRVGSGFEIRITLDRAVACFADASIGGCVVESAGRGLRASSTPARNDSCKCGGTLCLDYRTLSCCTSSTIRS